MSWAAWWQGDLDATFAARERAFRAYRRADNPCAAARMAMWLAADHFDFRGDDAVAAAWLRRAQDLVADRSPCSEQGLQPAHGRRPRAVCARRPGRCDRPR